MSYEKPSTTSLEALLDFFYHTKQEYESPDLYQKAKTLDALKLQRTSRISTLDDNLVDTISNFLVERSIFDGQPPPPYRSGTMIAIEHNGEDANPTMEAWNNFTTNLTKFPDWGTYVYQGFFHHIFFLVYEP